MDQIAIISDVHSNLPALEAVLADIAGRGIEQIYCLGDLVGKGPDSACVVDLCRERCAAVVKGNWDDKLAESGGGRTRRWHQTQLGAERLDYLRTLPNTIDFLLSGKRVRLFHASAQDIYYRVGFWHDQNELRGMFANTPFTGFASPPPDIVGYGDIHHPYLLPVAGKTLFNVGSVGNPMDYIPLAGYVIMRGHFDSSRFGQIGTEIIRLPYDIEAALAQACAVDMPKLAEYAFELRHANHRSQMPDLG